MTRSTMAMAIILVALAVSACGNPPPPTPAPTPSTTPSPVASSEAPTASSTAACTTTDIRATGGAWGGAAGSRGSDIILENVGTTACLLPATAIVALVDPSGTVVLSNAPAQAGTGPEVPSAGRIGFSLVLGNWCDQGVSLPLRVELALATESVDIADLRVATMDDLPPCNGPGQPASISTTEWQTADPG